MTPLDGTVTIRVDGHDVPLKLTLGALAELEDLFAAETIMDLTMRLANPSAGQLLSMLRILATAAGGENAAEALRKGSVNLTEALGAIAGLFRSLMAREMPAKMNPATGAGQPGSPLGSSAAV